MRVRERREECECDDAFMSWEQSKREGMGWKNDWLITLTILQIKSTNFRNHNWLPKKNLNNIASCGGFK